MSEIALEGMIDIYCRELRLPGLLESYQELARDALDNGISPMRFLLSCLEHESLDKKQRQLQSRMKAAKFPIVKALDSFDFALIPDLPKAKVLNLAESGYVQQKENILCLGPSGTGKTHVATALGISAIEKGYRVRFIRTVTLAQELLQAQQEICLNKYLKSWHKMDLVILDELGYIELGPGAPLLFQFVADRYENGSMIVTSNLEFSRWEEIFGNAALTTALLDRLTHRSHILIFRGESHRFRESRLRLEESEPGILEHLSKGRGSG
jgi:DNA replication protein DnaC